MKVYVYSIESKQSYLPDHHQEAIENAWNLRELASNELRGKRK